MASMLQGAVVAWTSPALLSLQSEHPPVGSEPLNSEEASWLGSLACLGSFCSVPIYAYIVNKYSRKITGYCVGIPPVICWIVIIFAQTKTTLYAARFVIGALGAGMNVLCPLYVTDVVEDNIRGAVGTYFKLMFYVGIFVTYSVGSYTSYTLFGWFCFALSLAFPLGFFFLPESPIYLAGKDKDERAKKSLLWLRGKDNDVIEEEMRKIRYIMEVSKEVAAKASFSELFISRGPRKGLAISFGVILNHILSGTFVVITFSVTIFKESGSNFSPELSAIFVAFLQVLGMIPAASLMDRAGRKILLIISNIGLTLVLTIFGGYYYLKEQNTDVTSSYGWLPVICLCMYVVAMDLGVSPIPFIIINEVFPLHLRSYALALNFCFFWICAFFSIRLFLPIASHIGMSGCYWFFALCCLCGAFFAFFIVPETKNRSLDSILLEVSGKMPNEP